MCAHVILQHLQRDSVYFFYFFILCYFVINAIENDVIAKLVKDLYLFVHLFDILCAYLHNLFLILIHD